MEHATVPTAEDEAMIRAKDKAAGEASRSGDEPYKLGEDSMPRDGVPRGQVTQHQWKSEKTYPGTTRDYWVYVPAQYDGHQPACLMVFQDGAKYVGPQVNVPIVFDNLIHKKEMPVTIGLFINPGDIGPGGPPFHSDPKNNRCFEYDSLGHLYASFVIDELIPELAKQYTITKDPEGRAICGISSGGICAFTVAWERPDAFRKVVSHCGSFTNIRGGHNYPTMIRKTPRKPLRVFLQSGAKDLDIVFGCWPVANRDMAAAFAYREYDYQFVFGEGGHTVIHGASVFPETMRWLWRDFKV